MMRKLSLLLLLLHVAHFLWAQTRVITGQVSDEKGMPLTRASILVKGTSVGTTSDEKGGFSLSLPDRARTLVVSYAGMASKEIAITSASRYEVSLSPASSQNMTEVVVVGYGTQNRRAQTGAISAISGKELENRPFSSVDKMLQGEVPGLLSVAGSGQPGSTQNVRLRGIGSISASSAPLYVIDGIPVIQGDISRLTTTANAFAGINPNDIENITVLKDAASTSIYGSQAANGVILISTKKGRSGKARIRLDVEYGQNDIAYYNDRFKPVNAAEWAELTKEGLINAGNRPGQADTTVRFASTYGASDRGYDTDWFGLLTRKGKQQQYNLSISGGTDRGTYYLSGGYYQEDGIVIQSTFKRYTAALRGRNKVSDRLNLISDISLGVTDQSTPPNSSLFANPTYLALVLMPTRPAYNPDGSYNISDYDFLGLPYNPLYLAQYDKRKLNGLKGTGNLTGELSILKNLKFTSRFGVDYNTLEENQYNNPYHGDGRNDVGRGFSYYTRDFNWVWTNFADYSHSFLGGGLKADLKVGYEAYSRIVLANSLRADGFPPSMDLTLAANAATPKTASASQNDKKRLSAFSNLILNYNDRYILSGSFRRDGSSVFGAKNRYGNFWSVGTAWNVDQEAWFSNQTALSSLKLRASYGVNGNESGFGYYEAVTTYSYSGYNYNQQTGSAPNNVGDPELTWELNKPFNVGFDLGLLQNRITVTTDYYTRTTTDLLLAANTSRTTGWSSYTTNIGEMQNKGVEVGIKAVPVQTKDFSWTVNLNGAYNQNKVTALYQNKDVTDGSFVLSVGYDYRTFFTRLWAGADPANGDPLWYTDETKKQTTNDVNRAPLLKFGTSVPKFFGGFSNTLTYKGFTFDFQFNFAGGHYQRDGLGSLYLSDGASASRGKVKKQLERWQKPGDITDVPKYIVNGNKTSNANSTRYLYKSDYARLRNVQLAYTLSNSLLSRIHLQGLTVYARGTNLLTLVKDKDLSWDPEQGINSQFAGDVFIPKTVTVGLNISF
jgi:TonB-dependent starch-binding outer membrane protein SusC